MTTWRTVERTRRALALAEAETSRADREYRSALGAYAIAHPLTEAQRATIAEYVTGGGHIYGAGGMRWLLKHVNQLWADALNSWAEEALELTSDYATFTEKVRKLKLDRFPGGTT